MGFYLARQQMLLSNLFMTFFAGLEAAEAAIRAAISAAAVAVAGGGWQ